MHLLLAVRRARILYGEKDACALVARSSPTCLAWGFRSIFWSNRAEHSDGTESSSLVAASVTRCCHPLTHFSSLATFSSFLHEHPTLAARLEAHDQNVYRPPRRPLLRGPRLRLIVSPDH